jgi:hypothetical protein
MKNYDKVIERLAASAPLAPTALPDRGFDERVLSRLRKFAPPSATAVWQWFALRSMPVAAALCVACLFAARTRETPTPASAPDDALAIVEAVFASTLLP